VNARNGLLVGLLVTVVAAFGFYTLALKPKRQEAAKLDHRIAKQHDELQSAEALLATNQNARDHFRQAYATVVRLGKAVPADDDVRSLVVQLHAAARRAGVDFASIGLSSSPTTATSDPTAAPATPLPPGATVGPAGFPTMQFQLQFRGRYFGLGDFLHRLHGFVRASNDSLRVTGRLLTLDGVKLEPQEEGLSNISATVDATTYLVSPLEGLTGGATASGPSGAGTPAAGTTTGGTTAAPSATATPGEGTTPLPAPAAATSTGGIR
jgi:Tfp pilus assembly protein PilO